jgi:hypothetical protein
MQRTLESRVFISAKHDPLYYAQHTVTKAQMELQRGAAGLQSTERNPTHTSELSHEQ